MAEIVSLSLNKNILKQLDSLQKELGFSGRSETVRAGIRELLQQNKERAKLKGTVDAVILITHDDKYTKDVSEIRHQYTGIIKTQIHNHLENHLCSELFVLRGNAPLILELFEDFQRYKHIGYARLISLN